MRKMAIGALCLAFVTVGPVGAASTGTNAPEAQTIDRTILHAQVILDHLGFSPGILDGRPGKSLPYPPQLLARAADGMRLAQIASQQFS